MFDCFSVRFVSQFWKKKPNFQNGQKSRKNRTNMDIILSFLAKPVDKHGITLVHITYPPLMNIACMLFKTPVQWVLKESVCGSKSSPQSKLIPHIRLTAPLIMEVM